MKVRIELTIVDLWSTALPLGYFTIYNTPSGYNLINSAIFSHGDDKSELDNRHCQASYHCLAPVGLTTCKFHGSFRIELYCKQRFCFYCHTATLTKFLCYTHILYASRQTRLFELPALLIIVAHSITVPQVLLLFGQHLLL